MGGGGSHAKLLPALNDPSNQKVFESTFLRYDTNKNGSLSAQELGPFVEDYFSSIANDPSLSSHSLSEFVSKANRLRCDDYTFGTWKQLQKDNKGLAAVVITEISTMLLNILDTNKNRTVQLEEWRSFPWSHILEELAKQRQLMDLEEWTLFGRVLAQTHWQISARSYRTNKTSSEEWQQIKFPEFVVSGTNIIVSCKHELITSDTSTPGSQKKYVIVDGKITNEATFCIKFKVNGTEDIAWSGDVTFFELTDVCRSWKMNGITRNSSGRSDGGITWEFSES